MIGGILKFVGQTIIVGGAKKLASKFTKDNIKKAGKWVGKKALEKSAEETSKFVTTKVKEKFIKDKKEVDDVISTLSDEQKQAIINIAIILMEEKNEQKNENK